MLAVFCSHLVSIMQFRQSLLFFSSFIGPFDFVLRCLNLFMSKPYFHCVLTTNHWHEELYSAQVSLASFFWVFFTFTHGSNSIYGSKEIGSPQQTFTYHLSKLHTHLLQCPCWRAAWCRWGRRWRWHSDQSWAWRVWTWFLKRMTHRSSGIHHTFQLRTFHYWNTAAEMRSIKTQSTGHGDNENIHKRMKE